jgi:ankyrin repeat protein
MNGGLTALHLASWHGNFEAVCELLKANPHLADKKNERGKTPLDLAQVRNHEQVALKLQETITLFDNSLKNAWDMNDGMETFTDLLLSDSLCKNNGFLPPLPGVQEKIDKKRIKLN